MECNRTLLWSLSRPRALYAVTEVVYRPDTPSEFVRREILLVSAGKGETQ